MNSITANVSWQEKYCEFNTNIGSRPKDLLWLCNSINGSSGKLAERDIAVVVYWPKMLLVVGPNKDWVRFAVEEDLAADSGLGSAVLGADVDGVRIVTINRHEFLQHVPGTKLAIVAVNETRLQQTFFTILSFILLFVS